MLNGAGRYAQHGSGGPDAAEHLDHMGDILHVRDCANIEQSCQATLCRIEARPNRANLARTGMDIVDEINAARLASKLSDAKIGEIVGLPREAVAKVRSRIRGVSYEEGLRFKRWIDGVLTGSNLRQVRIRGVITAGIWQKQAARDDLGFIDCEIGGPNTFALRVVGDSMDLFVEDGGAVAVDPDDRGLEDGRIYAVRHPSGETTLKRFRHSPARLEPMSTNPTHGVQILGEAGYEVIGRIVWRQSKV